MVSVRGPCDNTGQGLSTMRDTQSRQDARQLFPQSPSWKRGEGKWTGGGGAGGESGTG